MGRRIGDRARQTFAPDAPAVPAMLASGLKALFDVEYEPMYRLAYTMLGTADDAEEVVQDAFIGVARRWDDVKNPGGYLRVSVVNGARMRMRSANRKSKAEASLRVLTPTSEPSGDDHMLDLIDGLPERQRAAVVLTYYAGLNSTEVGETLDCPPATARSLVHRALARLREEVSK